MKTEKTYPIKVVSQLTGLSVHVIRAWEKRYNAVIPVRTDTNRRLYRESDIEKLNLLIKLTENGHNIGGIASMSVESLKEMFSDFGSGGQKSTKTAAYSDADPHVHFERCLDAVQNFNAKDLESNILSASIALSQPVLFEQVFIPLAKLVGDKWKTGELRVYQEHMFSVVVKSYLLSLVDSKNVTGMAPSILVTTPQGQIHEIGALIAAAYASSDGWKVSYLGPNLPAEEILAASLKLNTKIIALSIVYPDDHLSLRRDLLKFGEVLPKDIKIIVGGQGAQSYRDVLKQINAILVEDFVDFRKMLSDLRNMYFN